MKKLLSKPLKAFTLYALIILLCSIPVYYWVIDHIWMEELDEHNRVVKEQVEAKLVTVSFSGDELDKLLKLWNSLQPGITLIRANSAGHQKDSLYVLNRQTRLEMDRFRVLASYITAHDQTFLLTVESNIEESAETVEYITMVTAVFFVLLVLGFIILNKRIAGRVWKPFTNTLEKLQSFDLSKAQQPVFEQTGIEEFQQLNETLDKLIQQNISVYNQQKVFIENASHELQTPLAILKSKMDMLLQTKGLSTEQLLLLENIDRSILRMSRINKNLLLLAKIENSQFGETSRVELAATLHDSVMLVADYIQEKKLLLNNKLAEKYYVSCNNFLLETLINNLLINSIRHTPAGGEITIELNGHTLIFSNSGTMPLNKAVLFERFGISSKETMNSGLGLAIIKEICNRYGWQINYTFNNNFHSFELRFG